MKINQFIYAMLLLIFSFSAQFVIADEKLDISINAIQHEWAQANYATAKDTQEAAFKNLTVLAHQITQKHGNAPEALIWEGIANASYAKATGGLSALKIAEKARDLLLAAERLNPNALQGSAYTSLGSLYYKVPGWPIGFGDKKIAKEYLEKALQINPNGIDTNYFYADYLNEIGENKQAIQYYEKALKAALREGREDADLGRKAEIEAGIKRSKAKS